MAGRLTGLSFGLALAGPTRGVEANTPRLADYPFTLGVASGDPLPTSVVLWTRLAPDPLSGGGMPPRAVPVEWQVAADSKFRHVVQRGSAVATPALGHSVHVEVSGLNPARSYFYRFRYAGYLSPVGRTKTVPAPGARVTSLALAFASCQSYEGGYFTAYQHMVREDLDLVFFLGDYIYEHGRNQDLAPTRTVRMTNSPPPITLEDYRNRYALYRSDVHLRAAHAAFPWVVTWDDHEVENNYAGMIPEAGESIAAFRLRRAAAYQAYYEHMPLRGSSLPRGPYMRLYRTVRYGDLASFFVLDTRQYRDDQANGDVLSPQTPASLDPRRTLLGRQQEQWLARGIGSSPTHWNVLAQQIFFAQLNLGTPTAPKYSMDGWDGYPAARQRLVDVVKSRGLTNVVVLSGDFHVNWASNLKYDFDDPRSDTYGVEFVGTSVTSDGNGSDKYASDLVLADNPHVVFCNDYRGYVRCEVTPEQWRADYQVVPFVTEPDASISTRESFVFNGDRTGLHRVSVSAPPRDA